MLEGLPVKAGGNVFPSRFVKLSAANAVAHCAATTDRMIGIAHEDVEDHLGLFGSSTYHRTSSSKTGVGIYGPGRVCLLESGAAYSAAAEIGTDTVGRGIAAANTGDYIGAIALEAPGGVGVKAHVLVVSAYKK